MWPFHHESKRVIILKTVGVCFTVVIVVGSTYFFLRRPNSTATPNRILSDNDDSVTAITPAELKANYLKTLIDLNRSLENDGLSAAEARDKTEHVLFIVRVPKEMLDKHLETVLAVRRLKDKPRREDVILLVDYLTQQASL